MVVSNIIRTFVKYYSTENKVMYKNKKTGEWEYSSIETKDEEYVVVTIYGDIITEIQSELKARGVQRRSAGAIFKSTDTELIKKASHDMNHLWDEKKIEFGYQITDEVKIIKYSELYG